MVGGRFYTLHQSFKQAGKAYFENHHSKGSHFSRFETSNAASHSLLKLVMCVWLFSNYLELPSSWDPSPRQHLPITHYQGRACEHTLMSSTIYRWNWLLFFPSDWQMCIRVLTLKALCSILWRGEENKHRATTFCAKSKLNHGQIIQNPDLNPVLNLVTNTIFFLNY